MSKFRLLIVDDRAPARAGLQALLATWPEVEIVGEAMNGQEAIQQAQLSHPDIILMDIEMPVMNGLEATRRLKTNRRSPAIIILTMYPDERGAALDAGADAFLVKGCSTDLLLKTIGQVGQTKEKGNQSSSPKKLKFIKESVKNSSDRVHDHLLSMNWRPRLS